jgi:hypothetical protein
MTVNIRRAAEPLSSMGETGVVCFDQVLAFNSFAKLLNSFSAKSVITKDVTFGESLNVDT